MLVHWSRILWFLCVALVLASCSHSKTVQPRPAADGLPPAPGNIVAATQIDSQAVEKVDTMVIPSELVYKAYHELAGQCMESLGYPKRAMYPMQENYPVREFISPKPLSVEQARTEGYAPIPPQGKIHLDEVADSRSEEETLAFRGAEGKTGCEAQALEKLFGDYNLAKDYFSVQQILLPYTAAAMAHIDPLNLKWAECMKQRYGIETDGPMNARMKGASIDNLALKDSTCREETDYESKVNELLDAYMTTFLNDNQALIERVATAKQAVEERAPQILK